MPGCIPVCYRQDSVDDFSILLWYKVAYSPGTRLPLAPVLPLRLQQVVPEVFRKPRQRYRVTGSDQIDTCRLTSSAQEVWEMVLFSLDMTYVVVECR